LKLPLAEVRHGRDRDPGDADRYDRRPHRLRGYGVRSPGRRLSRQTFEKIRADLKAKKVNPLIPWNQWEACAKKGPHVMDMRRGGQGRRPHPRGRTRKPGTKKKGLEGDRPKGLGRRHSGYQQLLHAGFADGKRGRPGRSRCSTSTSTSPCRGQHGGHHGRHPHAAEVMEKGIAWIKSIGFVPLTVKKELLGFCFNRVWRAIKRETLYMWGQRVRGLHGRGPGLDDLHAHEGRALRPHGQRWDWT